MKNIRHIIALIMISCVMSLLGFITVKYGNEKEILTMVISIISFVIGAVTGYYFSATHKSQMNKL